MDKVIIEDYYNGWKHELDGTSTFIVNFFVNPRAIFLYIYLYFNILENLFKRTH